MKFTFEISVDYDQPGHDLTSLTITDNLSKYEEERLRASYESGKYKDISEDANLDDIYLRIMDMADELVAYADEFSPVFSDYTINESLPYPEELSKTD